MNRLNRLLLIVTILGTLVLHSCTEDTLNNPASLTFTTGSGYISSDVTLKIYTPIKIGLTLTKGDSPLNTIEVLVNGTKVDISKFKINGTAASGNPQLLVGTDKDGVSNDYDFGVASAPGVWNFIFNVTDDAKVVISDTLNVTFTASPAAFTGTGLIVYNFSGSNFGGLDLFNAMVVSGKGPAATIRDFGVVDPVSNGTWVKKLTPLQGSVIKNVSGNEKIADIIYKEHIEYLFNTGYNDQGSLDSKVLADGDVIIVKNGTNYFAVSTDKVINTANDNLDNYSISIKR
ncbi:MAG: hypothetical protein IT267_00060 [Saprospiraceae bacterium]|nr:hypothetical protein [Saprospiraceae bacterium]